MDIYTLKRTEYSLGTQKLNIQMISETKQPPVPVTKSILVTF